MEHSDSHEDGDAEAAGACADSAKNPTIDSSLGEAIDDAADAWPSTAIERQLAAEAARKRGARQPNIHADNSKPQHVRLTVWLALLLLVATGLVLTLTDSGRSLREATGVAVLAVEQKADVFRPSTDKISQNVAAVRNVNAPRSAVPKKTAAVPVSNNMVIPIAAVTLRNRPQLLEQLVEVYRSELADHPGNSIALASLRRLRERSLAELEAIVATGSDPDASRSLEIVSRLFPELAARSQYQSLAARVGRIESHTKKATSIASTKTAPSAPGAAKSAAKAAVPNAPTRKPEIRVISMTPGTMVEHRFIPSDDGNVLMTEISYRNFDGSSDDNSGVALVARLGIAGDSQALAEVPVVLYGDRGTKSFPIEPLSPGDGTERYRLNFFLHGELLVSRAVHLSAP